VPFVIVVLPFLTSFTIPNSVEATHIDNNFLLSCKNLTSITIPYSVTHIGYNFLFCCTSLKSIIIQANEINIIGDWFLYDCKSLTSITILGDVTHIGNYFLLGCTSLNCTSINVPANKSIQNLLRKLYYEFN
jgi:hypothetical protein